MSNAVAKLLPTHDNSLHRFHGANDSAIMPIMSANGPPASAPMGSAARAMMRSTELTCPS